MLLSNVPSLSLRMNLFALRRRNRLDLFNMYGIVFRGRLLDSAPFSTKGVHISVMLCCMLVGKKSKTLQLLVCRIVEWI